jgi:hypothetical protein
MTQSHDLDPGSSIGYSTKPTGLTTLLSIKGNDDGETTITYHYELCCQPDHTVNLEKKETKQVNISDNPGAICTVRNTGFHKVSVWTDY